MTAEDDLQHRWCITSAGGTASLLDVGQDELLYICSLLGRQQQAAFPMLCRSIASILRASGEFNLASCQKCDLALYS